LEVAVINSLVSPALDAPIQINVYVSACEDFKLGEPIAAGMKQFTLWPTPAPGQQNGPNPNGEPSSNGNGPPFPRPGPPGNGPGSGLRPGFGFEPQSGEMDLSATTGGETDNPTNPESLQTIAAPLPVADQTLNVFFGECPTSIRELNRRYVKTRTEAFGPPATGSLRVNTLRDRGLGYYSGYDPNGIDSDGTNSLTIAVPTFAQYFSPCYAVGEGAQGLNI
jgi:hypothetical protein